MGWFSRRPKQRVYRILYLLNDKLLDEGWVDAEAVDDAQVASFRRRLPVQGKGTLTVQSQVGELELTFTIGGSHALVTTMLSGKPLLSSVVLSEGDATTGVSLVQEFLQSLRRSKPVTDFAPSPESAYERIGSTKERPLVGSVHWPIVRPEQFATLKGLDAACAAAVLWRPSA